MDWSIGLIGNAVSVILRDLQPKVVLVDGGITSCVPVDGGSQVVSLPMDVTYCDPCRWRGHKLCPCQWMWSRSKEGSQVVVPCQTRNETEGQLTEVKWGKEHLAIRSTKGGWKKSPSPHVFCHYQRR
jgi:hypothetical protein